MKINTADLIKDLTARTQQVLAEAQELKNRFGAELNQRSGHTSWSALEAIQHLNLYGNYYLPEIEKAVISGKYKPDPVFKSGLLEDYFAKMMLPDKNMRKMKTLKDKNPFGKDLDPVVIDQFISHQKKCLTSYSVPLP